MYWNTKIKIYPDGSTNTIYCNQRIFNDNPEAVKLKKEKEKESCENPVEKLLRKKQTVGTSDNMTEVRSDSLKRAKDKIQDLVMCNDFEYFVTLTFNPERVDSYNVTEVKDVIKTWLKNGVRYRNFKYVAIPEYHKSGRIHMHAVMSGDLKLKESGHYVGNKVVYNITDWSEKYGFCTAIKLDGNINRVAYYVTKYITKGNDKIFGRFYWSSRNLERSPKLQFKDTDFSKVFQYEYKIENTYRSIKYEADFNFEN